MSEILKELGLTQEQMTEIIANKAVEQLLTASHHEDEGEEYWGSSEFRELMEKHITETIDAKVTAIAEKHVLPGVEKMIGNLTLQETNKWGEKRGESLTFIEYLIQRAEVYMKEEVDYKGRTKSQRGGCQWSSEGTRVAHMVHEHLRRSIESAMKEALSNANSTIVGGLEKAVKMKLDEIAKSLKVHVNMKQ